MAVGDHLYGGAGNDSLVGLDGDDLLDGGAGNDVAGRRRRLRHATGSGKPPPIATRSAMAMARA
jgi:Ca2+-binding RTX toxin-like protein